MVSAGEFSVHLVFSFRINWKKKSFFPAVFNHLKMQKCIVEYLAKCSWTSLVFLCILLMGKQSSKVNWALALT